MLHRVALTGLLVVISSMVGCGAAESDKPELVPVTGVVTMDGKPLDGAIVTFTSAGGQAASGRTDADGKYELMYQGEVGAPPGDHTVTIESSLDAPAPPGYKDPIPAKYNTKTELKATVSEKAEIPFELTK